MDEGQGVVPCVNGHVAWTIVITARADLLPHCCSCCCLQQLSVFSTQPNTKFGSERRFHGTEGPKTPGPNEYPNAAIQAIGKQVRSFVYCPCGVVMMCRVHRYSTHVSYVGRALLSSCRRSGPPRISVLDWAVRSWTRKRRAVDWARRGRTSYSQRAWASRWVWASDMIWCEIICEMVV